MKARKGVSLMLLALCAPSFAHAGLLSVRVDGIVTSIESGDGLLPFSAARDDLWSFTYLINDTPPPDSDVLSDADGVYDDVIESITVAIGGNSFTISPPGQFSNYQQTSNASPFFDDQDFWGINAATSEFAVPPPQVRFNLALNLFAPGASALTLNDSFIAIPDLASATSTLMFFGASRYFDDLSSDTDDVIRGRITSITPLTAVPEPGSAGLLVIALALLAFVRPKHCPPRSNP